MSELSSVKLKYAIEVDGVSVSQLKIRRPKVRDMLGVESAKVGDAEKEINLFANLCEVTPESLMDLDMSDYAKLQKAYQDFLS